MENQTKSMLRIDIWSDVICPFCYIGKRKLELALAQTQIAADIHWHSFELNPNAKTVFGKPLQYLLVESYGLTESQAMAVLQQETVAANAVGLDFNWQEAKPGNTFNAHRLLHLAKQNGLGNQAEERFFRAYFSEGLSIGDIEVLRQMSADIGLDADQVNQVLEGDAFADAVRADEAQARQMGIRGVPYFVINGNQVIEGARDVADFVTVLRQEVAKLPANTDDNASDAMCQDGFCTPQTK